MKTVNYSINKSEVLEYKKRKLARKAIVSLRDQGKLVAPKHCELCHAKANTAAHHTDYGQPLNVIWLCKTCHGKTHHYDHPLNPRNVKQTDVPLALNESDKMLVTFSIPIENFLLVKKIADEQGVSFSKVLRGCVMESFPVDYEKSIFNKKKNKFRRIRTYEPKPTVSPRVQVLEYANERVHKQESQKIFSIWTKGSDLAERVEIFSSVHSGHGGDAAGVRWTYIKR